MKRERGKFSASFNTKVVLEALLFQSEKHNENEVKNRKSESLSLSALILFFVTALGLNIHSTTEFRKQSQNLKTVLLFCLNPFRLNKFSSFLQTKKSHNKKVVRLCFNRDRARIQT
jgi:hypothetical protein